MPIDLNDQLNKRSAIKIEEYKPDISVTNSFLKTN